MTDYAKCSQILKEMLDLRYEPVAVTLVKKGEPLPEGYTTPEKNMRHCQSIMRARKGEKLLIPAEKHACVVGGSALGLLELPEKVRSGEFHYNLGMFGSVEAAKRMIEERPQLEYGSIIATAVSPLSKTEIDPDVVVITGMPEQVYWVLPVAAKFSDGGKMVVELEPFQATCAYSTVYPYLNGIAAMSIGCYGCRRNTDMGPEEMLVGIPVSRLEDVVESIQILRKPREKALADNQRLREQSQAEKA
jgi:uncharacterized protein (DUF169 family)